MDPPKGSPQEGSHEPPKGVLKGVPRVPTEPPKVLSEPPKGIP